MCWYANNARQHSFTSYRAASHFCKQREETFVTKSDYNLERVFRTDEMTLNFSIGLRNESSVKLETISITNSRIIKSFTKDSIKNNTLQEWRKWYRLPFQMFSLANIFWKSSELRGENKYFWRNRSPYAFKNKSHKDRSFLFIASSDVGTLKR